MRAFVDHMLHQANQSGLMNDGVAIVHAVPGADIALDLLEKQDGLYHVLLEGIKDGRPIREITLVDAITGIVRAHEDFAAYRELYLSPGLTTIVSNTTEAGIAWVEGDDLSAQPPASFPAKITALLHDRWQHFDGDPSKGLRVVCCELIEDNASTLREYVLRHAAANALPADFVAWVETACSFHDTLVDRIVPGYPRDEIDAIQAEIGYADSVVVKGEYFGVWAIATGTQGGPGEAIREVFPLDKAGQPVEFMPDIRPFRAKKVRILNGLHTALAQFGLLVGCESVREAFARDDVTAYLTTLLDTEVLPSIPDWEQGEEARAALRAFAAKIVERFGNPYLHHRLADISLNSVSKWQARNLPVALDAWAAGREAPATVAAFAALAVLYSGQGSDAAAVATRGFEPRDDAAPLAAIRDNFDARHPQEWLRAVIDAAGFFTPEQEPLAARLAAEAGAWADVLLTDGAAIVLKELSAGI